MYTNLIRLNLKAKSKGMQVGGIHYIETLGMDNTCFMIRTDVVNPHRSDGLWCVIVSDVTFDFTWLTQQEVDDLFEPQAPKKHEFTYGQRVVIEESQQEYYCLGYTSEGRLITTRKPYDLEHCRAWCKDYSDDAQPYVEPKVKLTAERLNADYGKGKWELYF